jgi:hypothetical protein
MDDVVEQGRRDRWVPPRWLRGSAVAVAVSLAVLVVTRPHLLSADRPAPHRPKAATPAQPPRSPADNTSRGISIVTRQGDHLERYEAGSGRRPLATLPRGVPDPMALVYSPLRGGSGRLVGVDHHVLFRASPVRGRTVTSIAPADRVLAVSSRAGRLFVLQPGAAHHKPRLVELDARTGATTDGRPFPGYHATGSWRAAGIVSLQGDRALVLTRAAGGGRLDLALAWDHVSVRSRGAPEFARIGSTSQVLGVAETHILVVDLRPDTCIDRGCPIRVLTVTRTGVLTRTVQPPPGWRFGPTVVGGERGDPLVVVSSIGNPGRLGLARLLGGGPAAQLVAGTDGLVESVTPVSGPEEPVVLAVARPEGMRLSVVLPGGAAAALLLDLPVLAPGAELVCACR